MSLSVADLPAAPTMARPLERGALASSLPSADLEQLFARFRDEVVAFRDQVLMSAGGALSLPPSEQAAANLGVVRSIFGKWSIDILTVLVTLPSARFSDLRRTLKGISSDVLSRKLFELESVGMIERRVGAGRPPTVEYRLTEDGLTVTRLGEPVLLFLRLRLSAKPRERRPVFPP